MNVDATVNFENGARLFLINNFFSSDLDVELFNLFANFKTNPDWQDMDEFSHNKGRLVYCGSDPVVDKVYTVGKNCEYDLSSLLGKTINFTGLSLWTDSPGYTISPHYDAPHFDHAVQIYMTDPTRNFEMMGTAFYKADKQYLFEIPYRRNSGYFIDATHNIMHGLHHHIPPEYYRYSVYLRYQTAN